jgi:hypothetical protein
MSRREVLVALRNQRTHALAPGDAVRAGSESTPGFPITERAVSRAAVSERLVNYGDRS